MEIEDVVELDAGEAAVLLDLAGVCDMIVDIVDGDCIEGDGHGSFVVVI